MFRLARRIVGFALTAVLVYLAVTLAQVGMSSRRDGARPADAVIVFGAAQYNGTPSPVLGSRLDHAAELYNEGLVDTIVVTGGSAPGDRFSEARAGADYLASEHGVPQDAILREVDGRTSWQSLASAANELRKRDKTSVVLVSDPFHAARIGAMAGELGLDAVVSPTQDSPISGSELAYHYARETVAVAAGRIVGFRRLHRVADLTERLR